MNNGLSKMPSVRLILKKVYKDDTEGYLFLRVGIPGTKRYVPKGLGRKVPEKYWDSENEIVKRGFDEAERFNKLNDHDKTALVKRFDDDYKGGVLFSEEHIRAVMFPAAEGDDFVKFYRAYIDNLIATKKKKPGTIAVWETEYNQFSEWVNGSIPLRQINTDLLNKYHKKIAHYEPTTVFKKLKKLRQIISLAIRMERISPKQVAGFEMIKYQKPVKEYLTLEQVQKISKNLYKGEYDRNETLRMVAAYFLIEVFSGIRWSDWGKFKVEKLIENRSFKVIATKNGKPVYLPLDKFKSLAGVVDYIAANDLKFKLSEGKTNQYLKILGASIDCDFDITTHTGRRTAATLWGEMGYTTRWIANVLGVTERTALGYITVTERALDAEIEMKGGL